VNIPHSSVNESTEKPKILVIIPAFNEEDSLPHLLAELSNHGLQAVVVNDCSSDKTAQVAKSHNLPVLDLPANLGIGGAVQTGFKYALTHNFDIVVQIDGDGQHDCSWVSSVVAPIIAGEADCVIGSRYLPSAPDLDYNTPFARRVGMHFSTAILHLASGLKIHDTTSGFRALNRRAFEFFSKSYPVDHPEAEALLVLHRNGYRVVEVPVKMHKRAHGTSLFNFTRSLMYPLRVIIGFVGVIFASKSRT
jgi:glycosyltransferase involved in cell wall biosynthesis